VEVSRSSQSDSGFSAPANHVSLSSHCYSHPLVSGFCSHKIFYTIVVMHVFLVAFLSDMEMCVKDPSVIFIIQGLVAYRSKGARLIKRSFCHMNTVASLGNVNCNIEVSNWPLGSSNSYYFQTVTHKWMDESTNMGW
jgi:hypothetical protein